MRIYKRLLALLMVVFMSVALIGCGGDANGDDEVTTRATTEAPTEEEVTEPPTEEPAEDDNGEDEPETTTEANNGGEVTTTAAEEEGNNEGVADLIPRTTNAAGNASAAFLRGLRGFHMRAFYPWEGIHPTAEARRASRQSIRAVQDEFGVRITERGQWSNYMEALAAALAARRVEDHVVYAQDMFFASWFSRGYLANLNTPMRESGVDFADPWYVSTANGFLNVNGNQFGWIPFEDEYTMPFVIIYNKNLLNRRRLADPAELASRGQWTWRRLEQHARAFENDNAVTGFVAQEGPGQIHSHATMLFATLAQQHGAALANVRTGREPTSNIANARVRDALNVLAGWTTGRRPWVETFRGQPWNFGKNQFRDGQVAMLFGTHDDIQNLSGVTRHQFGVVPFPTREGTRNHTNLANPQFIAFVPVQHQRIASRVIFVRNELYRHMFRHQQNNFQASWRRFFRDAGALENAANIRYAREGNRTIFNWIGVTEDASIGKTTTTSVLNDVLREVHTPQGAVQAHRRALESNYSDVWSGFRITGDVSQ